MFSRQHLLSSVEDISASAHSIMEILEMVSIAFLAAPRKYIFYVMMIIRSERHRAVERARRGAVKKEKEMRECNFAENLHHHSSSCA
jgi:hypothetical protein